MKRFALATALIALSSAVAFAQNLLPNAQQVFFGATGQVLSLGFVYTYVPGTTTPKLTWQDSAMTVPNTNPITLDANGQARIWASGTYRQVVNDSLGNLVWDQITQTGIVGPTSSTNNEIVLWGSTDGGTVKNGANVAVTHTGNFSLAGQFASPTGSAANFLATSNFTGATTGAALLDVMGTTSTPDVTQNPVAVWQKWSNSPAVVGTSSTTYTSIIHTASANNTRATAGFFEAQENGTWGGVGSNPFVEGVRAHGTVNGVLGAGYGVICSALENPGATHTFLIGCEGETHSVSTDATTTFSNSAFSTSFNAISTGTKKVNSAYMVNPFTGLTQQFIYGFYIPTGSPTSPVSDSAFKSEAATVWGLDLSHAPGITFGGIGLPNGVAAIRIMNGATSATLNSMTLDSANELNIGIEPNDVRLGTGVALVGAATKGFVMIPMGATPTGAPVAVTSGYGAIYIDSTLHKLCMNDTNGGAGWRCL